MTTETPLAIGDPATLTEYSLGPLALPQWHHLDTLHVYTQDHAIAPVPERGLILPSRLLTP